MLKEFKFGINRRIVVEKTDIRHAISIEEVGFQDKSITLTEAGYARLKSLQWIIDQHVDSLIAKRRVAFKTHLSYRLFVTIKSGFFCVDIRIHSFEKREPKASSSGISLRVFEWKELIGLFDCIDSDFPSLANV
jgi:hypothetical protein